MAYSSGTFSRLFDWTDDRDNGIKIRADRFDQELDGFATGLSSALLKDGTQTATAKIPFAVGLSVIDNQTVLLGTNSDIAIQYDESTNDSLEIAANVEGAALNVVLKSDQGDDNADQHKLTIADGGTLTLGSKISGSFVSYLTHTPNATVASSTLAVAGNLTVGGSFTLGSGAVLSEAELEMLDGITAGTVIASKAIVTDSDKDITGGRNITITGELDAATGDFSGDVDVDGTLEADAITVNGTALATVIAGTTVTNATNSAHVSVADNESTNEENLIPFIEDASATGNVGLESDGNFAYNPSTGTVSATVFKGNIDAVDGDFDGTLEADAITLDGTAITATATLSTGISNNNVPKFTSGVVDDDFLRVNGTAIEGRSASEVLSDIGGQAALTFGISDTNIPIFTSGVADDDFLRVNGTSIEGRSASEVLSDIGASAVAGSSSIVTTGALDTGSITSGFGAINNGASAITTTGVGTFGSLDISGDIDVDGTTNLDVVDIDGAVDMASTLTVGGAFTSLGIDDNADAVALTIDSAENVAIGVTSKNSANNGSLTIGHTGMTKITGSANGNADELVLIGANASANVGMSIISNNTNQGIIYFGDEDDTDIGGIIYDHGGNVLAFQTNTAERMRIDTNGKIQMGTTSTDGFLHIKNNFQSDIGMSMNDTSGSGGTAIRFKINGTTHGSIAYSGSGTAYNTSSDYRLKENVDYTFDATTRLKKLKPARFNFISDDTNTLVDGFIAHEVQSVVPEAISGDKDATETYTDDDGKEQTRPSYQGIDQAKLVPLLVKTIQELEARITALESA